MRLRRLITLSVVGALLIGAAGVLHRFMSIDDQKAKSKIIKNESDQVELFFANIRTLT